MEKILKYIQVKELELTAKKVKTYQITIWIGQKEGYNGPVHSYEEILNFCQGYVDEIGLAVTVTPTTFVYTKGREPGVGIGLINYPRFPSSPWVIRGHAFTIAKFLMKQLNQKRCSVVCPDITYLLENDD